MQGFNDAVMFVGVTARVWPVVEVQWSPFDKLCTDNSAFSMPSLSWVSTR